MSILLVSRYADRSSAPGFVSLPGYVRRSARNRPLVALFQLWAVIGSHRPFYVVIQMSSFASRFYGSPAWKSCRDAFRKSRGKLCERCLARGIINAGSKENPLQVHHKIRLTPDNIDDPSITLNWDNLETLCQDCHAAEHPHSFPVKPRKNNKRWSIGENGEVIVKPDTPLGSRP